MSDHEEIPYDEIETWYLAQVNKLGPSKFGRKHSIDKGLVSRNRKRIRDKKGLPGPFTKRIADIMAAERAEEQRRQRLAEQAAAAEQARQEKLAAAKAKRAADHKAREARDKRRAEEARRDQELEKEFIRFCERWEEKLREAGYLLEGDMIEGDANELPFAIIHEVNYIDIAAAAVALLPDDYVIWRDKTAAFFREDVPYTLRLQPTAVPEGQLRPAMIGNLPASTVFYDPLPHELWFYGKKGAKVVAEWRELTDAYGHLATGKLPRVVHRETVRGFERLIQIEGESGFVFEDSRLGPDARDRLKSLQRRAILLSIAKATKNITWRAIKSTARWCYHTGWKWLLGLIAVLMVAAVVVGLVGMAIEVTRWVRAGSRWIENRIENNSEILLIAVMLLFIAGIVTWWVWPKERDTLWTVTQRVLVVVGCIVMIVVGINFLFAIPSEFNKFEDLLQSLSKGGI